MKRFVLGALLLSTLHLAGSAAAATASATMEVSFVVKAACVVDAADQDGMPGVSCNAATPYRVAPAAAASGAAWTITF